jgi:hypothetical protein
MFRLPVSGLTVSLRFPAGDEDLLLLEAPDIDTRLAIDLMARLAEVSGAGGGQPPKGWEALPAADLEALLLSLRQMVFGDTIRATAICPVVSCRKQVEVSFRISEYLAHHAPRRPRSVSEDGEPGWWRLGEEEIRFRLPTAGDQAAVRGARQPTDELRRRCVRPEELAGRHLKRVEQAMEALAPSLSRSLEGKCPECRSETEVYFDLERFVLTELRDQAAYLYRDVHLLAKHYHWPEQTILALPRYRRLQYAEILLDEGARV